ncbi:methyltransferase [Streptomyces sp. W16]|uniref:methyltransferase n=1 Tax=Streptomyces sp. W16 TaxID=3076631 RepID=UPI00295B6326|nr:methyltransferase domain-containing protein [Streptomyces sp. W16]MDV9169069.1 methyltransferase [Streptomyces sp. W16]
MSYTRDYTRSLRRCEEARSRPDRPQVFSMRGREWDLLDDVFAPVFSPATEACLDMVEFPRAGSVLEMGSGCGLIAVEAALAGCRVVAADISPQAVENTRLNAARHHVGDRLLAVESDLFSAVPADERFDLVVWNSNYVLAPEDYQFDGMHQQAYVDPGYRAHRRFLEEAPGRLTAGGSVLLSFSTRGDLDTLRRMADDCDRTLSVLRTRTVREGTEDIVYRLVEVSVATTRAHRPAGLLTTWS